jgi:L-seryl-tRNA(Ser) seleniumtransferase
MSELLRRLPAVTAVLDAPAITALLEELPRQTVVAAIQEAVAEARATLLSHAAGAPAADADVAAAAAPAAAELLRLIVMRAGQLAVERGGPSLRRVVNATGIVLHTNLGRALLAPEAIAAAAEAAGLPTNLEYDLVEGKRGSRHDHVTAKLAALCGSEDAFAVNNNAGAVLLMLNTLAEGREVIVSRGELVEIGGSFRIPEIMRKSGARLVEVGTTNRTHLCDYRQAIGPATALILKVHPSNYRVSGFVAEVEGAELAALGRQHGLPVMYDLGSGAAPEFAAATGLAGEPSLRDAIAAGIQVVTASGDKLFGGPQAGIIAGNAAHLAAARQNPLARALRLDKMTIAAMQATLDIYLRHAGDPASLARQIPVLFGLCRSDAELEADAQHLAAELRQELGEAAEVTVRRGFSEVGGGAFATRQLPTHLVAVRPLAFGASTLASRLRAAPVPVIGRVSEDAWLADPRMLNVADAGLIRAAMRLAFGR